MVSRYRGESASPQHQGDRNCTCTENKSPIPGQRGHFWGTRRTTGFTFKERGDLKKQLVQLSRSSTPFAVRPKELREAVWVEPKLIAEVVFTEWTSDGSIRHPSFQGLREDKKAKDVVRELPNALLTEAKKRKPARAWTRR